MSKYKKTGFIASFKNAFRGIRILLKSEKNFRIHAFMSIFVMVLAILLDFSEIEMCILVLTVALVLLCEMINSAIEFALDSVFKNKYSKLVGMAKDISAGAVTTSAIISVIIGCILFTDKIADLFW